MTALRSLVSSLLLVPPLSTLPSRPSSPLGTSEPVLSVVPGVLVRRGEVRLVDLDPVRGAAGGAGAGKRRPAVVVSNDGANAVAERLGRGVVTVVPVISNTPRVFLPGAPGGAGLRAAGGVQGAGGAGAGGGRGAPGPGTGAVAVPGDGALG